MGMQQNRRQAKHFDGRILHWCIRNRNALVQKEIQQDFGRRQKRLLIAEKSPDLYDGTVNIFPISSSAYWKVQEDSQTPVGFPAPQYTGIPALNHWFRYATVPDREKHLDSVLNNLHGLFNSMNTWSGNSKLNLTKEFVEAELLHRPLQKIRRAS
jgi:hypothetical protein